jgi:hypothetical protein
VSGYQARHRGRGGHVARRYAALGLLSSSTVAAVMFIAPTPVSAQAPDAAAWWNSTNVGDPAPTPPPPPDVKSGDLFVQGSNAGAPLPVNPLGAAPATTQAVSGVSFDLPNGALVNSMTLPIDGTAPPQISVVVCATKEPFTSTENGPWSEVPSYDGNACSPGKLKGNAVEFADIGKLVLRDKLSVLILPGPLDRIVFKAPGNKTLDVSSGGGVGAAAPPLGAGTGSTTTTGGKGSSGTAAVGGTAVAPPPSAGLPGAGTTSSDAGAPPLVAGSDTGTPAASQTAAPAASSSGLSTRDRRIIALIVIAAEVVGYALLMRNRAPAAAPVTGTAAVAGGKLRAPDRWAGGRAAAAAGTAGVGRFRRDRIGPAPHL